MRHRKEVKKFGRSTEHRIQLMRMMVANLILADKICTTVKKAKETRKDAERMVTIARKGTLAARRLVAARLRSPEAVKKLFDGIVPAMEGRAGGYTRIVKTGFRRGDATEMCFIEWVAAPVVPAKAEAPAETPAK